MNKLCDPHDAYKQHRIDNFVIKFHHPRPGSSTDAAATGPAVHLLHIRKVDTDLGGAGRSVLPSIYPIAFAASFDA